MLQRLLQGLIGTVANSAPAAIHQHETNIVRTVLTRQEDATVFVKSHFVHICDQDWHVCDQDLVQKKMSRMLIYCSQL